MNERLFRAMSAMLALVLALVSFTLAF